MKDSSKKNFRFTAIVGLKLLLICTIVAAAVSLVFTITDAKYQANLVEEKRKAIIGIFQSETLTYRDLQEELGSETPIYEVLEGEQVIGYCLETSANGFGGEIQLMVGFEPDGTILGVKVVSHSETPGLGEKVSESDHLSQYQGKKGPLKLRKDIDAVQGASISSRAVLEGVNKAVSLLQQELDLGGVTK